MFSKDKVRAVFTTKNEEFHQFYSELVRKYPSISLNAIYWKSGKEKCGGKYSYPQFQLDKKTDKLVQVQFAPTIIPERFIDPFIEEYNRAIK